VKQKQAAGPDPLFGQNHSENAHYAMCMAAHLYSMMHGWGLVRKLSSALTGRSNRLLDLAAVRRACDVGSRRFGGTRAVPLDQIRGSEGRCRDFDADFRPLGGHTKDRWVGIATAQQMGRTMPPVDLIQVGDVYFVRDGHHRISVARALGQKAIDAQVTVWQVSGPLPWERRPPACTFECGQDLWGTVRSTHFSACAGR
jgi:hypothetical protein